MEQRKLYLFLEKLRMERSLFAMTRMMMAIIAIVAGLIIVNVPVNPLLNRESRNESKNALLE